MSEVNGSGEALNGSKKPANRARQGTVLIDQKLAKKVQAVFKDEAGDGADWVPAQELKSQVEAQVQAQVAQKQLPPPQRYLPNEFDNEKATLVGFLVSCDKGSQAEYFELRVGRSIVSGQSPVPPSSEVIEIVDPSVSVGHATLKISESGHIMVLDQFSITGTAVQRLGEETEEIVTTAAVEVADGDIIRFGLRRFHVTMIKRQDFRQKTSGYIESEIQIDV